MRRLVVRLAALGLLLGLLPISVSGCGITCACLSTPDPNWTPPPVSAQEATAAVAKFAISDDERPVHLRRPAGPLIERQGRW